MLRVWTNQSSIVIIIIIKVLVSIERLGDGKVILKLFVK